MSDRVAPPSAIDAELRWTVHPAGDNPPQGFAVAAVIFIASVLTWRVSGSTLVGLFALVLLSASLRAFFLPRRYTLDAEGAAESGPLCRRQTMAWDSVRRVSASRFGLQLSALHNTSRLVAERGLFLRTSGRQEQVRAFVDRHVTLA
jgi:hypothetical protein